MLSIPHLLVFALSLHKVSAESYEVDVEESPSLLFMQQTAGYKQPSSSRVPRIAIIGAGIAGASTAHHLHQLARRTQPLNITVFETENRVGGRIKSVGVHDEPWQVVEAGAVDFSEDDWCISEAMREVGLKSRKTRINHLRTGIWDGEDFLVEYQDEEEAKDSWWRSLKWLWRYGWSAHRFEELAKATEGKYRPLFEHYFRAPQNEVLQAGLKSAFWSARGLVNSKSLQTNYVDEVIRPKTRHQHARDVDEANGLSAQLALDRTPHKAIVGGNQRLPHRMLKISEANVQLDTRISGIFTGEHGQWTLEIAAGNASSSAVSTSNYEQFDIVVITAPFAFKSLSIDSPTFSQKSHATRFETYVERHTTLFSTTSRLSPDLFNHTGCLPENILTAPKLGLEDNVFFSITVAELVQPADAGDEELEEEYVYRISSKHHISDTVIALLVGYQPFRAEEKVVLEDGGVTWIHREKWNQAYPAYNDQCKLKDIEIAPDLYYTAIGDEVVSSMEMGCRMGKNQAENLFWNKWIGEMIP